MQKTQILASTKFNMLNLFQGVSSVAYKCHGITQDEDLIPDWPARLSILASTLIPSYRSRDHPRIGLAIYVRLLGGSLFTGPGTIQGLACMSG